MSGEDAAFDHGPHIETTPDQRLVYMANQIAKFFAARPHEAAVAGTAEHIAKFWDPRMRAHIRACLSAGGEGLDPVTREAVGRLVK